MQKVINTLALLSFAASASIVGAGAYVYFNKDALIDQAKEEAMEMITGALFSGPMAGDEMIPDLPDPTRFDETGASPLPVVPFGM